MTKNSKNIGMSELIKIKSLMENKKDKPIFISDPDNDYILNNEEKYDKIITKYNKGEM